jgi:hypothetical protein
MMTIIHTDRSRCETAQRCNRARWLAYHEGPSGMGITSAKKPLALALGGAVHVGLADLLMSASAPGWDGSEGQMRLAENVAVTQALADFATFDAGRLEPDLAESAAQDLSTLDAGERERVRSDVDQYLYDEQRALVEAMVRAYARRRLRPLLEQYEVLEVEREGEWKLADWTRDDYETQAIENLGEIRFMSRPDALLRDRQTSDLYIQSFKTGASWDVRKGRDAEHDAQGLSEGVEIEKRLGEWWQLIRDAEAAAKDGREHPNVTICKPGEVVTDDGREIKAVTYFYESQMPGAMYRFLRAAPAPPRVLGIRYEFLWKGERRRDKDLTARFGVETRSQSSHLVRGYHSPGMTDADAAWNWSWEYAKEGGETSKLYWKAWRGAAVWEHMPIRDWIDKLDATVLTTAEEGREVGWSGPAQATGFTTAHPLDLAFHPALIVYRNEDDLRDWIEQTESQEVEIAERVAAVRSASDEGEKRSLLNRHFRQSRHACIYPSECQFTRVCYGGEDIRRDPIASGLYQIRQPHHAPERDAAGATLGGGIV